MLIDLKMLQESSLEEILEYRNKLYEDEIEYAKKQDKRCQKENQEKLAEYNAKYPYLTKPVEQLTLQEKQGLVNAYVNLSASLMAFGDYKTKDINELIKRYSDVEKVQNSELDMMKNLILSMTKPYLSDEHFYENSVKQEFSAINFKISREDAENPQLVDLLEDRCKSFLAQGIQVKIVVNTPMYDKKNDSQIDYLFSGETMQRLIELNNNLHHAGMKQYVMVNEFAQVKDSEMIDNSWTLKDVVKANRDIDRVVNDIKSKNLSPFETMVYIHKYVTSNFAYKEGTMEECRVIPGIFKTGNIVCSGYASVVKAIVDKLDMPELKCMIVGCEFYKKSLSYELEGGHCHNLIYMKDDKYGIDGYYMEDACWDAKTPEYENGRGLAHCMYPVGDVEHIKGMYYVQHDKGDRLSSLMFDTQEMEKGVINMAKALRGEKTDSVVKQYFDRRNKARSGADIAVKYKNRSNPISVEQYSSALKVVLDKFELCEKDNIDETTADVLNLSSTRASMGFDKKSASNFVANNPNAKKSKGQNSLKSNDGRQG